VTEQGNLTNDDDDVDDVTMNEEIVTTNVTHGSHGHDEVAGGHVTKPLGVFFLEISEPARLFHARGFAIRHSQSKAKPSVFVPKVRVRILIRT
jgi:hypothetical protein